MEKKFLGTVILPGMYDPLTVGHMNSLKYLSERCDKVFAVIMTLKAEEGDRFVPSQTMKTLIEQAVAAEGLDNVSVYIEDEGWLARSVEELGANGVARSFHPSINIEKEMELIRRRASSMKSASRCLTAYSAISSSRNSACASPAGECPAPERELLCVPPFVREKDNQAKKGSPD